MGYQGFDHHHGTENDLSPSQHLVRRLKPLALDEHEWFLGGSAALALRDIRRVGDIDVGVTTRLWAKLLEERDYKLWVPSALDATTRCDPPYLVTEVEGTEVHFFHGWRRRTADETRFNDFNAVFAEGLEFVKGWPVIKLTILLRQKVDAVQWENPRAKDLNDIIAITQRIKAEAFIA